MPAFESFDTHPTITESGMATSSPASSSGAATPPEPPQDYSVMRILPLAAGAFAMGTATFVTSGVLPEIAEGLGVGTGAAGQAVTAYALAYAVLAPVLGALTGRMDRRAVLVGGLVLFTAGSAAGALAPSFGVLIASRAVAAAGAAVYTPNAAVMASVLSPPRFQGRAMAVVVGGMTAATALGVPLGTWLGTALGWRAALWMVALTALVALAGMALLPGGVRLPSAGLAERMRALGRPRLLAVTAQTLLVFWGSFTVFAYIALVFAPVTGGGAVGAALLWVWGLASVAGNLAAGRASDARGPRTVMLVALPVLIALFLLVEPAAATLAGAFAWMLLHGGFGWLVAVPQQQRAIAVDPPAAPVLIGLNSSALYGGMSLGGITGGAALAWLEPAQLGYLGAALLAPALLLLWAERRRG